MPKSAKKIIYRLHDERLYKEYLNRNDDKAVKGPDGLGKEMK